MRTRNKENALKGLSVLEPTKIILLPKADPRTAALLRTFDVH